MKFNTGDRVRIIKYGSVMWCPANDEYFEWAKKLKILKEEDGVLTVDTHPEWIGEEAIVEKGEATQNMEQYILQPFNKNLKVAWYSVNQLELVNPNVNETTMAQVPHETGTP